MTSEKNQKENLPKHVAIIMDGNRRWAKKRGLPAFEGHRRGAAAFEKLIEKAGDLGIKCLSAWAFSTENWNRSKEEIDALFSLLNEMLSKYGKRCEKEKVRFVHIGRKGRIPSKLRDAISRLEEKTCKFTNTTLVLAIDYGGHDEIIRSIEKINKKGLKITPENIEKNLDTADLPQIDFIIRTGGETRLSGFMSWQSAYAELYFTDTHFPAFSPKKFEEAIMEFSRRERRFGGN